MNYLDNPTIPTLNKLLPVQAAVAGDVEDHEDVGHPLCVQLVRLPCCVAEQTGAECSKLIYVQRQVTIIKEYQNTQIFDSVYLVYPSLSKVLKHSSITAAPCDTA